MTQRTKKKNKKGKRRRGRFEAFPSKRQAAASGLKKTLSGLRSRAGVSDLWFPAMLQHQSATGNATPRGNQTRGSHAPNVCDQDGTRDTPRGRVGEQRESATMHEEGQRRACEAHTPCRSPPKPPQPTRKMHIDRKPTCTTHLTGQPAPLGGKPHSTLCNTSKSLGPKDRSTQFRRPWILFSASAQTVILKST